MWVYISTIYLLISKGVDLIRALWHQCVGLKAQRSRLARQKGKQPWSTSMLKFNMRMFPVAQVGWLNWQLLCLLAFLCQQLCVRQNLVLNTGPTEGLCTTQAPGGFPSHLLRIWRLLLPQTLQTKGSQAFRRKFGSKSWCPLLKSFGSDWMWTSGCWEWEVGGCQCKERTQNHWVKDWGEDDGNSTRPNMTLRMSLANHMFSSTSASPILIDQGWHVLLVWTSNAPHLVHPLDNKTVPDAHTVV